VYYIYMYGCVGDGSTKSRTGWR